MKIKRNNYYYDTKTTEQNTKFTRKFAQNVSFRCLIIIKAR